MKKINYLFSIALMFMLGLQVNAGVAVDTIFTEGFVTGDMPTGWVDVNTYNTASATNSNELYGAGGSIKLKQTASSITTTEYFYAGVFSFYCFYKDAASSDGVVTIEKSTNSGVNWTVVNTFVLNTLCTIDEQTYLEFTIDEEAAMLRISWADDTKGIYVDDFCLTQMPTPQDNVVIASVSADTTTVSYESIIFTLKEGTDDIYVANDSIAYGDDAVTITVTTVAPAASVSYSKQTVNPAPGASDTAVFEVTAEDGTTKKTYKAIVARSHYQCKQGFNAASQYDLTVGWSREPGSNLSTSAGNNGLFYGDRCGRMWNNGSLGNLQTPVFTQVGSISLSAKFSNTDGESLIIEKSTDNGNTWTEVDSISSTDSDFPTYADETDAVFGRKTFVVNELDVQLQFRVVGISTAYRTAIDDIAIKATDYANIPTAIKPNTISETSFIVYPNPASTFIKIQGDVSSVSIYSLTGRLVKQSSNVEMINIQSLESGVYLVKAGNGIEQLIVR